MISVDIPGRGTIDIKAVAMDMNGTIAVDGKLLPEIKGVLDVLKDKLDIFILTSDTYGTAGELRSLLPYAKVFVLPEGSDGYAKVDLLMKYGWDNVVAIGNGCNDMKMFGVACIKIAVVGKEGACAPLLRVADIVVGSVVDAVGLLLNPRRLVATLRL